MCICGHTFTTSDQVSSLSINHNRVLASMAHVYSGVIPACLYMFENFPADANIAFTFKFSPLFFSFKNKIVFTS